MGERLPLPVASGELGQPGSSDDYALWPLKGVLSVYDQQDGRELDALKPGQTYDGRGGPLPAGRLSETREAGSLRNNADAPALCLEIRKGCFTAQAPQVTGNEPAEERPWGSFTVLRDDPCYKLKQLVVRPGNRLSLQRHQRREEIWMVLAGHPRITLDEQTLNLGPGDTVRIPLGSWHRIANPLPTEAGQPAEAVEIIELQLGDYFGEDDIERREDDYGRV
jgi:mannose-1-phosphate guanylyltransferase/mannose-6-phosphate isomerase